MNKTILIVDDDKAHLFMLQTILKGWGYGTEGVEDGEDAVERVKEKAYNAVLMDIKMARMSGVEALAKIKAYDSAIPVLLMTAYSSVGKAVEAMKLGAYDYLTKPLNFDELKITLERCLEHVVLLNENKSLKERLTEDASLSKIIGQSQVVVDLVEMVKTVSATDATILLSGESGTGKELFARAIHSNSQRKEAELVTVNCAALTDALLESELFGHEKGAFTGADKRRDGRFMQADGGTIFLDEIGEMPLLMQAKLLRTIQEREIQRVGSDKVLYVDVRVVAATNRDLLMEVTKGTFREDLYYRLNVVNLHIPSLKERIEDIPLLASFFLTKYSEQNRKNTKGFTPIAMDMLTQYGWPGNIRELENAIERAIILCTSDLVSEKDLPPSITQNAIERGAVQAIQSENITGRSLQDIEKSAITGTLAQTGGKKSEAAKILNITRTTLDNKMKKYGITITK